MIDIISVLTVVSILIGIIAFGSVLLYSVSCFSSHCKELADYFAIVSTSTQALADWNEEN